MPKYKKKLPKAQRTLGLYFMTIPAGQLGTLKTSFKLPQIKKLDIKKEDVPVIDLTKKCPTVQKEESMVADMEALLERLEHVCQSLESFVEDLPEEEDLQSRSAEEL